MAKKNIKKNKQDKAIADIIKILKDNNLTIYIEHQIVIKPIKNNGDK